VTDALVGLAVGALVVGLGAAFVAGTNLHLFGTIVDGLAGALLLCLAMAAVHGALYLVAWAVRRLASLPPVARTPRVQRRLLSVAGAGSHPLLASTALVGLVLVLGREGGPISFLGALVPFEIIIAAGAVAGALAGGGWALRSPASRQRHPRIIGAGLLAASLVLAVGSAGWAVLPGGGDVGVQEAPAAVDHVQALNLPDPGAAGPHAVVRASYGSGAPARRPEFGADATWRTEPVDASGALDRPDGIATWYSDVLWGFDTDALPVNGLVWYAGDATQRLPVVLIVHGNHAAGAFSDPGYAYLAEHLASRGMLAVSVDENFLNGDALFDYGGSEMGVRAWLLLRHLDVLRHWNADPSHPLHDRLDLDRVALIGHSRGGEAAALAVALAAGDRGVSGMPDPPSDLGIRAVVGIAPSDGMASGTPIALRGVDYLVIQGAHDGDLPAYHGLRTFHRADVSHAGGLKVAVYVGRANHGRFNTVWDDGDAGPIHSWMLDRGSLLTAAEQQRVARVVVAAFLARSLQGDAGYDAFLRDPRSGRAWLPNDVVETHWQTGDRVMLADLDPARIDRRAIESAGFTWVSMADPMLRDGTVQGDAGLHLAWESPTALTVRISPDEASRVDRGGVLTLSLGTAGTVVPDVMVTLRDRGGNEAGLRMSEISPPRPVIPVRLWKLDGLDARYMPAEALRWPADRFLQTHALDLSRFHATNPDLDVADLTSVTLGFDGSGEAFVDDLGFEPGG
jgi:hypothetical protein